ncbi:MAG: ribose-phosphate pyrophosphokinase [Defluviitaleaceae bacterium]|nr:ribose-phosphate pyrophosphokinase [Defluviitaleaceae bacterium]
MQLAKDIKAHSTIGEIRIFSANANRKLAEAIAKHLGKQVCSAKVSTFSDGEIQVKDLTSVRGADVFIVQPTSPPVNDHLMELLIMIDAMRRSSAARITAVIPYFGYARQDRVSDKREPISARLVADLITAAGADRILTIDLHSPQIQGFFNIPVDHLKSRFLFANYVRENLGNDLSDIVVVSPDTGSVANSHSFACELATIDNNLDSIPLAVAVKRRIDSNTVKITHFIGDVKDKTVILLDDLLTTGTTLYKAVEEIQRHEPKAIYACITHPILVGDAVSLIEKSALDEVVVLDTIAISDDIPHERIALKVNKEHDVMDLTNYMEADSSDAGETPRLRDPARACSGPKLKVLSVAKVFADAINHIHEGKPIGELLRQSRQF